MTPNILVTQARIPATMTPRDAISLQSGDIDKLCHVLGKFVTSDTGEYITVSDGYQLILDCTFNEIEQLGKDFAEQISKAAVPPTKGTA